MKKTLVRIFLWLLAVAALPSCKSVKDPELRGIEDFSINRFGLTESSLSLKVLFFNPNKFRLKLKEASGSAWLDGNSLGHFTMDSTVHIPAKGNFILPVELKMDMRHFVENISSAFQDKLVMVKLEGKARAGKGIFYINYPLRYEGKHKLSGLLK